MDITYKINTKLDAKDISFVFKDSGIKRPYSDLERLERMFNNSNLIISAWEGEKLVGLARSITDFSYCCYLSDLAVVLEYQNKGIGKELIDLTKKNIGEEVALILLASPKAMDYYPHIGFKKLDNAFRIPRTK